MRAQLFSGYKLIIKSDRKVENILPVMRIELKVYRISANTPKIKHNSIL